MKKFVFTNMLSFLLLCVGSNVVFAYTDTSAPGSNSRSRMDERVNAMQKRMEDHQEEMGTHMEEQRAAMEQNLDQEVRDRFEDRRAAILQQHEEVWEHREARYIELRQRWEERKAQLSERRKENIKNHIERIIKRMEQAVERMGKLVDRIEKHLSLLEQESVDVAALKVFLGEARAAISRADSLLDTAAGELRAAPDAANPADAIGNAHAKLEDVKMALREAHAVFVEVVVEIKKGQLMPTENKSDTAEKSDNIE